MQTLVRILETSEMMELVGWVDAVCPGVGVWVCGV